MINNENIMYMYCNVLGQTEPEKILDIGLFYRQIGGVSRTILNSDVPKKPRGSNYADILAGS